MIINCLEEYDIEPFEYAFLCENTHHASGSFKFHIPKVMTFGRGKPKKVNNIFNNNIFVNDSSCKPVTSNSITTQNYVTVKRHFHTDFSYRADVNGIVHEGTRFIIQVMHGNIKDLYVRDVV
jgi:hypothetical protein